MSNSKKVFETKQMTSNDLELVGLMKDEAAKLYDLIDAIPETAASIHLIEAAKLNLEQTVMLAVKALSRT